MNRLNNVHLVRSKQEYSELFSVYFDKMKGFIKEIPIKDFPIEWERNILTLLPERWKEHDSALVQDVLNDVKALYMEDMQILTTETLFLHVTSKKNYNWPNHGTNTFKEPKRIFDNSRFFILRDLLEKKYFLCHETVRSIIKTAYFVLPNLLCNFGHYRSYGIIQLSELQKMVTKDIKKGASTITNQYYLEVSEAISRSKVLQNATEKHQEQILRCATHVFVQQILQIMTDSINNIISVMERPSQCPQINLQLICEHNKLLLRPTMEEIFSTFHNFIRHIENIAANMIPFEKGLNVQTNNEHIKVKLPKWFVEKSHNRLQTIMDDLFLPINGHLENLVDQFNIVCAVDAKKKILSMTLLKPNFSVFQAHIQQYNSYLQCANEMVANIYFTTGKLVQVSAKECLRIHCFEIINILTTELVKYHRTFNQRICSEFDNLRIKALNIPKNAISLIELTNYMSHASKVLIKELEKKVEKSIHMLGMLLQITTLTEEHIQLNRETINWLYSIESVFYQNNNLCESMKSELEDDLQRRINILNNEVDGIFPQLVILNDMDDISRVQEYIDHYRDLIKKVKRIDSEVNAINTEERLFRFPETLFPKVDEIKDVILPFHSLICTLYQWQKDNAVWLDGPFEYLNANILKDKVSKYLDDVTEMNKTFKTRIKMDIAANKSYKFSGIADDPDPMQQPAPLKLCWQALNQIHDFKTYLPLAICMCNPALKARHWEEMSAITGFDITPNAGTTLRKMIALQLMDSIKKYEVISIRANKELALQQQLAKMINEWKMISFQMSYNSDVAMVTFTNIIEIEVLFEEHLVKLEEMKVSHFVKPIISAVIDFHCSLIQVKRLISQWESVQTQKLTLKPIFSNGKTKEYLREERLLYLNVEETLKSFESTVNETITVDGTNSFSSLLDILKNANEQLERVRDNVKSYMEKKRSSFVRFFFLSDEDIQIILFESANVKKLNMYLKKCFPGIEAVRINKNNYIYSVLGVCGEELYLQNLVPAPVVSDCNEKWLLLLEDEVCRTVRKSIMDLSLALNETPVHQLFYNSPNIAITTAFRVFWTSKVQECIFSSDAQTLNFASLLCRSFLESFTFKLRSSLSCKDRDALTRLIIINTNQEEFIKSLHDRNVNNDSDFEWNAYMKYYWETEDIKVSIFNTVVRYGYEYRSSGRCLVTTPLNDRVICTLIQSLRYYLYAAIVGSSATGKTETLSHLVRSLAVPSYTFDGNEAFPHCCVSQIFKGILSSGAWVCFKSFERMNTDILSTVAQRIIHLSQTAAAHLSTAYIEGTELRVNPGNMCVIMNITNPKYTDLSDDLKFYFRTVAMVTPDVKRIVELKLFAGGFQGARFLSGKINILYQLLSEQLSNCAHYHFGMRSINAVVEAAIKLKRYFPDEDEMALILRSLIDLILPTLCHDDIYIFQDILDDLYPGITLPSSDHTVLLKTLEGVCSERSIHMHEVLKLKIIQTYELIHARRVLVLLGEPLCGKTEIIHTLLRTLMKMHKEDVKVEIETINPGVVTSHQLFGYFDERTKAWKDGLCSKVFQSCADGLAHDKKWLIFDGPASDIWMEDLHTILDTNRILCLPPGEKINIPKTVSVFFETASMTESSPAFVSHCGIVYIESESVSWRPHVLSHIAKNILYKRYDTFLYSLFDWSIGACLHFLRENSFTNISMGQLHLVASTLNLFDMYVKDACDRSIEEKGKLDHFPTWYQAALISAIAWGLGGSLNSDIKAKFNEFCLSLWSGSDTQFPRPETIRHFEISLPSHGCIQDHYYIFRGVGSWKNWGDSLKSAKIPDVQLFNQIHIPTVSTIKHNDLFLKHVRHRKPFLLCGGTANGKTSLMQNLLDNELSDADCMSNCFSFISVTTVGSVQRLLLSNLKKINRGEHGLPKGQLSVHFIDDVSCDGENTETKAILELLRQYLSYGYWYDAESLEKTLVNDTLLLMNVASDKNGEEICPRLLRHFNVYTVCAPKADDVLRIFSNLLFAGLKRNLFNTDVLSSVNSIANATVDVYNFAVKTLLLLPSKPQYLFSLADISKVMTGCSLIEKDSVESKVTFIRLWVHETLRVFTDRISNDAEKEVMFQKIKEAAKAHFKDSFEAAFDHLPKYNGDKLTKESFEHLVFGRFMDTGKTANGKRYEETSNMNALRKKIVSYLSQHNEMFRKKLDIIVSNYTLSHLIRISRILATPNESLIILSPVGSGRRSIAKLAAFVQQQSFFEPSTDSYYDADVWRQELKKALKECGCERKDAAFFIVDKQMKDDSVRDISSILSCGKIPDLFSMEERQSLVEATRLYAQEGDPNAELTARAVMDYFVVQCKARLHFILCFTAADNGRRRYLSIYKSLIKRCTVDWMEPWPEQALVDIATKRMDRVKIHEDVKTDAARVCVEVYNDAKNAARRYSEESGRAVQITPGAYWHMLKLYTRLVPREQRKIVATRNRYLAGLEKLELAAEQVERMKSSLVVLKPQLELSAQETATTMTEVEKENVTVERATILVKQEEEVANRKAAIAGTLKAECEADLAVAIPILEDAVVALNTLKPTDITLMKAMKNPPDTVKLVMAAVCVMLEVNPDRAIDPVTGKKYTDYWGPSKRILGDMNFLQNLKEYEKDNISPEVMEAIKRTYMTDKSFMPQIVAKASSAAEGLCKWVRAMVSYDEIAKAVAPKKEKLAAAQRECDEAEALLDEKRQTLVRLNTKLAALNSSLQDTLRKKLRLENEVESCTSKLKKAETLIASHGGEKFHWMERAQRLQLNYDNLPGDLILCSAIIAYTAPFNITFREHLLRGWIKFVRRLNIPNSQSFDFADALGTETEINTWYLCGLSKDRFSTENAIIMTHSELWCLFIDSQSQATNWIKETEKKNGLVIVKLTDSDYFSAIESGMESGKPVLIENLKETLDIALDPLFSKSVYEDGGDWYLDIGRRTLKYSHDFRLYLTTRLQNPCYSSDAFNKLVIIDFSIPSEALRANLLDTVISKEKPELQDKFEELAIQNASNKRTLLQQEDNILIILSSTTTNILEDENAIKTLNSSKNLSLNIMKRQEEAKAMTREINVFREAYVGFAKHCAELFNSLNTLSQLNHMYHFSFSWFIRLYITSIETSNKSVVLEKRLKFLKSSFTRNLHSSVCNSLFEKHKLVYSFLLCAGLLLNNKQTTDEEIKFFISAETRSCGTVPDLLASWLPVECWNEICRTSVTLPVFQELKNHFCRNHMAWKMYFESHDFETLAMPNPWNSELSQFQKLILVKILHREKLTMEIMKLIQSTMGTTFDQSPLLRLSRSYAESSCLSPLVFVLPSYCSPLDLISSYAATVGRSSKLASLFMNKQQEKRAEQLIETAQREGGWVFLQNCHLTVSWLAQLEKICENLNSNSVSSDFRLWISSYPIRQFPVSILHNSVKIANDYPFNLKQGLLRIYESDPIANKEFFEGCPGNDKKFATLLYGLSVFHIVARARNCSGPQGWNIPYDFDHSDFRLSVMQLQDLINEYKSTPFDTLRYFIGQCNYGGKVLNDFDQWCLDCLLRDHCNANHQALPRRTEYRDVLKHINDVPLDWHPDAFGTSRTAVNVKDITTTNEILDSLSSLNQILLQPSADSLFNEVLRRVKDIDDKLPHPFDIAEVKKKYPYNYLQPLNTVLLYEVKILNRVLEIVKTSSKGLRSSLRGEVSLTDYWIELCTEIYNDRVPSAWKNTAVVINSTNISNYISALLKRTAFIEKWIETGHPQIVRFDVLFSCKMFLSALKQLFSRRRNIAIEEIVSDFKVLKAVDSSDIRNLDDDTFLISGLHLCGARWDFENMMLAESLRNVVWSEMPTIAVKFVTNKTNSVHIYECPTYRVPFIQKKLRNVNATLQYMNNYVMSVPLETHLSHEHWIKCGTTLFCQLE